MKLRIWGLPVLRTWANIDPIQYLDDPDDGSDDGSAPAMSGDHTSDPDGPPVGAPEPAVERLDVPPQIRPWDVAKDAVPGERPPHCSGRHALAEGLTRCEYCEALTGAVSLVRSLEKRVVELGREVAELRAEPDRRGGQVEGVEVRVRQVFEDADHINLDSLTAVELTGLVMDGIRRKDPEGGERP